MLRIFQMPEKSDDFGRGLNPRTRVSEASMLTSRPPKSLVGNYLWSFVFTWFTFVSFTSVFQHSGGTLPKKNYFVLLLREKSVAGCRNFPGMRIFGCWNSLGGIATLYGLDVRVSNAGGGKNFRIRPDRPWGPPSLLYDGYRVSFPRVERPGRGVDHPP
jgi:hypothetical protein